METSQVGPSQIQVSSTHPLLLIAAASVTLLSLTGVGVLSGWLPGAVAHGAAPTQLTSVPAAPQTSVQRNVTVPQEKARKQAKSVESEHVSVHRNVPAPAPAASTPTIAVLPAPTNSAVPPAPTYVAASPEASYRVATPAPAKCNECGVVETVREIAIEPKASGGGAIAGGLVGGLIANQIGKGSARTIATILGVAGGAYGGNYIEKSLRTSNRYEVLVRFDDDSTRTFSSESMPSWQSGDRVKLQNGLLTIGSGKPDGRSDGNPATI